MRILNDSPYETELFRNLWHKILVEAPELDVGSAGVRLEVDHHRLTELRFAWKKRGRRWRLNRRGDGCFTFTMCGPINDQRVAFYLIWLILDTHNRKQPKTAGYWASTTEWELKAPPKAPLQEERYEYAKQKLEALNDALTKLELEKEAIDEKIAGYRLKRKVWEKKTRYYEKLFAAKTTLMSNDLFASKMKQKREAQEKDKDPA